ncbi:MAG TPA: hypothetical protein VKA08_11125 [Balneolales bacterium]|nr:hypothetical protein [Balneolales bacterium]
MEESIVAMIVTLSAAGVFWYVNQVALTYQIDQILPLYHKWCISGVRFGVVNVRSPALVGLAA